MSANIRIAFLVFFLLWSGCSLEQERVKETKIVVPGTGACEEILRLLAEAFNSEHQGLEVIIPKSIGSSGGIKAVGRGENTLGRAGRPLRGDELKWKLVFLPFAKDAVVFAVGRSVEIRSLTPGQLRDIFRGEIDNWRELGEKESPIRVLIRQPGEVSLQNISENLGSFKDIVFTDQAKCAFHDYEMVDLLNKYPTSIGFLTNSSALAPGNTFKVIGIGGVIPTAENLQSGGYPLLSTYGLVYREGKLSNIAVEFIDFIFSEKGSGIIKKYGLVPLSRRN